MQCALSIIQFSEAALLSVYSLEKTPENKEDRRYFVLLLFTLVSILCFFNYVDLTFTQ